MQTFFHILAVVISIFIPLVSIILLKSKTYALRSLDRSLLPPYPLPSMLKNALKDQKSSTENNRNSIGENDAGYQAWMGKQFEKCSWVFMLLIWKSLKVQKSPSLLLAAIRNPLLPLQQGVLTPGSHICNMKKSTGGCELYDNFGDVTLAATISMSGNHICGTEMLAHSYGFMNILFFFFFSSSVMTKLWICKTSSSVTYIMHCGWLLFSHGILSRWQGSLITWQRPLLRYLHSSKKIFFS